MTKYYTEGIWGGLGLSSGEFCILVILQVEPYTYIGSEIEGLVYEPSRMKEPVGLMSGLDEDKFLGPSVLCKWSD